jgi:hypothetical protein
MSRIRNIKPEFYTHEVLNDLQSEHPELNPMLVFSGLWPQCEYSGVFVWSIRKLKISILPFVEYDLEKSLALLEQHGFIKKFIKDGKEYGFVYNFTKYQAISGSERRKDLTLPVPTKEDLSVPAPGTKFDDTVTEPSTKFDDTVTEPSTKFDDTMTEQSTTDFENMAADLGLRTKDIGQRTKDLDADSEKLFLSEFLKPREKPPPAIPDDKPIENPPGENGGLPAKSGAGPPDDKPIERQEDAIAIWNRAREYWNERHLKPECRDIMMRSGDTPDILRTFRFYSWTDIKNAIGNFAWHKFEAGPEYRPPLLYGSLAGFLKAGVEKYFDDDAIDQQFKDRR